MSIRLLAMVNSLPDSDTVLAQFNRLIGELLRGSVNRNTFRPWEIDVLLDIEVCNLRDANKRETLRRYQKANRTGSIKSRGHQMVWKSQERERARLKNDVTESIELD